MSKFLYVQYRNVDAMPPASLVEGRLHSTLGTPTLTCYTTGSRMLFLNKPAPNLHVDAALNFEISFPVRESGFYLRIQHKESSVSVEADPLASRILWYYADEEKMILSSSQRAIVALAGTYEANTAVWTWMLINASLGPGFSWDKRISGLTTDSTLTFDLQTWTFKLIRRDWQFAHSDESPKQLTRELEEIFEEVKQDFNLGAVKTLQTLSGGYDSRATLYLLKHNLNLHAASWGVPSGFNTPLTDATVAKAVAEAWAVPYSQYNVQLESNFEDRMETFLDHGEGRNDHIHTFMDGLAMWRSVADAKYQWIVRADEVFGWLHVTTPKDVRTLLSISDFSDYTNISQDVVESLPRFELPDYLRRGDNEPLEDHRDRVFQQFRIPFVITPLQDLPLSFVELLNPLLHPKIVAFCRKLPPHLRTNKKLYADLVDTYLPKVPYTQVPAIPEARYIASSIENKEFFDAFFTDRDAIDLLGKNLMTYLQEARVVKAEASKTINSDLFSRMKATMPAGIKKLIRNKVTGYQLKPNDLMLRAYIIYRMQAKMKDAAASR